MISPPVGLGGRGSDWTTRTPITIRAYRDGEVLIDGRDDGVNPVRRPVSLANNDFMDLIGFDACCAGGGDAHVIAIGATSGYAADDFPMSEQGGYDGRGSDFVLVRRVVGWDAPIEQNSKIFSVSYSREVILEDVAGFGTARKIFEPFVTENVTIRRAWARWEGNTRPSASSPKLAFSCSYRSYGSTCENLIASWTAQQMPSGNSVEGGRLIGIDRIADSNPSVQDDAWLNGNNPWTPTTGNAEGRFSSNLGIFGSVAYVFDEMPVNHRPDVVFSVNRFRDVEMHDLVSYAEFAMTSAGIHLGGCGDDCATHFDSYYPPGTDVKAVANLSADRLTAVGPTPATGHAILGGSHFEPSASTRDQMVVSNAPFEAEVFHPQAGAEICHRYVDGVSSPSSEPLWPWPMNERIRVATAQYSKDAAGNPVTTQGSTGEVDVTAQIVELFGAIPADCYDSDGDAVADAYDNCVNVPNGPTVGVSNQVDSDRDGYGNACDYDFMQTGSDTEAEWTTNLNWLNFAISNHIAPTAGWASMDVDSNGTINEVDRFYAAIAKYYDVETQGTIMVSGLECADRELVTGKSFPGWPIGLDPDCVPSE